MKKGKWNYTQDIEFDVVRVRVLPHPDTPLHWQNAFAGFTIQAVVVVDGKGEKFYMSNEGGIGLEKIRRGGGPDSASYHFDGPFAILGPVPESEWNQYDPPACNAFDQIADKYRETHNPEEYKKLKSLREGLIAHRKKYGL